jgi:hypothetical protein
MRAAPGGRPLNTGIFAKRTLGITHLHSVKSMRGIKDGITSMGYSAERAVDDGAGGVVGMISIIAGSSSAPPPPVCAAKATAARRGHAIMFGSRDPQSARVRTLLFTIGAGARAGSARGRPVRRDRRPRHALLRYRGGDQGTGGWSGRRPRPRAAATCWRATTVATALY